MWVYIALGAAIFILTIYFLTGAVVLKRLMQPKKRDEQYLIEYETAEKKFDSAWLDIPCNEMYMDSDFGYKLFGRLYINVEPSDKFILCLHGHNSSGLGQLKYLKTFLELGYNVFIPDHRRSGRSGGKSITFGAYEKHDVIKWINILQEKYPKANFAVFGESMGAATAVMVAGMDKRLRYVIEYCGFANFEQLFLGYLKKRWLYKFLQPSVTVMAKLMYKVSIKETDALAAMIKLNVPVMIMHSRGDRLVSINNAFVFKKAHPTANLVLFDDAPHARSIVFYKDKYVSAIRNFVINNDNKPYGGNK